MNRDSQIDSLVRLLVERGVTIRPIDSSPWISSVEDRIGYPYPPSFRSLVTRYSFPYLEFVEVELFSNLGDMSEYELTNAPFRDSHMGPWLIAHRFVYIGHPYIGQYDPICLDLTSRGRDDEPPVVQLDHEDILLERKKVGKTIVAPSFVALLRGEIDA